MRFRFFWLVLGIFVILSFLFLLNDSLCEAAPFQDGNGSTNDPYQIGNWTHLNYVREYLWANFTLINNLDEHSDCYNEYASDSANGGSGWLPIGTWSNRFTGSFDGQNYTISNLFIDRASTDYVGLFGCTGSGSEICNIGLVDVGVTGDYSVGGLVGVNDASVSNSYTTGDVNGGGRRTGGLIGHNFASVSNSYSTANVVGYISVGGLIGHNQDSISNSYSGGNVTGTGFEVGGLVGFNTQYCSIYKCYSTGNVTGMDSRDVGGLVGLSQGIISYSYSTGNVIGTGTGTFDCRIGGLVGYNYENGGSITNCYSTGDVTGNSDVGGLVGENDDSISNSYSVGSVTGNSDVGGLVGFNSGTVTNSFWDTETSGQGSSDGGTGNTTAEMKTLTTFSTAGWDVTYSNNDLNDGYPHLGWQESNNTYIWLIVIPPVENIDTGEKFNSIQAAINDSNTLDGHTITVSAGIYYENLIINKSLTLIGENKNTTIIDGMENQIVVSITADHVNFSNFTVQNAYYSGIFGTSYGILFYSNYSCISNNIVKNNNASFMTVGIGGIYDNNTISNNIAFNNSLNNNSMGIGIYLFSGSNNSITYNRCYNDVYSVYLQLQSNCTVNNNTILGNNGTVLEDSMFDLTNNITIGLVSYKCTDTNIVDNEFFNTSLVLDGDDVSHYYQTITGNTVNGKSLYYSTNNTDQSIPSDVGEIILINYTNFTIENKIINSSTIAIQTVYCDNLIIRNSTLNNSFFGLYQKYSNNSIINNNSFTNNYMAIGFTYSYNNTIFLNNFLNNYEVGQGYDDNIWYNPDLNQGNYWDNYSGLDNNSDGIGDTAFSLDFGYNQDPYPLMYQRMIPPIFVWVDDDYNSSTPGWNVDHFGNIQDAVDNVRSGGRIYVYNGTYYENVAVSKSITLQGEDKNITIIDGGGNINVIDISANNTIFSGFTIKNSSSVSDYAGIKIQSTNNSLNNCCITNNNYGIRLVSSSNNNISLNTIYNNSHSGILFWSSSNNNTFSSNSVYNNSDHGISFGVPTDLIFSLNNTIISNSIYNNSGDGVSAQNCHIDINSNYIYNNRYGMDLMSFANSTITSNYIYNNSNDGIWLNTILINTTNCTINLNHIYNNSGNGIRLRSNCYDNNITNNYIYNNSLYQVNIYNSNNNIIYNNYFRKNTYPSTAYDNGNNIWYNTIILEGNYWDDYNIEYPNATYSNGIYDTPYNITGGSNNDTYPLVSSFEYYYILKFTNVPSSVTERNDFTVTVKTLGNTLVEGATVIIEGDSGTTNSNGQVTLTAPSVSSDTSKTVTATKTGYTSNTTSITVNNQESSSSSSPPPPSSNNPPVADADGPYSGTVNSEITFDGSDSSDPDGDTITYSWDFGDGTTGSGETVTHTYTSAGTYTINLTVSDGSSSDTDSTTATIKVPAHLNPPVADVGGPYSGLTYEDIIFDGSNSYDNGTITNYTWTFGDGSTGYGKKTYHTYSTNGTFTVKLIVIDDNDYTDTDTTTVNILQDTDADGWSDNEENIYGTNITDPENYPLDTDGDRIPDDYDEDDDNDGLLDYIEEALGSDLTDGSDVHLIELDGNNYYLVDSDNDGISDKLYDPIGKITNVQYVEDNKYLLDIDGDKKWDYIYDPASDSVSIYSEEEPKDEFPFIFIILIVVALVIVIVSIIVHYRKYSGYSGGDEEAEQYNDEEEVYDDYHR